MGLLEEQRAALVARFPWFDEVKCAAFFAPTEQQQTPARSRIGGTMHPAILMANGSTWFPVKDNRPFDTRKGHLLKSESPPGGRRLITDDWTAPELIAVEGEPAALALRSLGFRGVMVIGGTDYMRSKRANAARERARCAGKDITFLFDADPAGRKKVGLVARAFLESGATRVRIVHLPDGAGDPEDFALTFSTPEGATVELTSLITRATWAGAGDQLEGEAAAAEDPVMLQSGRYDDPANPSGPQILAFMTWEPEERRPGLAVFGPLDAGGEAAPDPDDHREYEKANAEEPPPDDPERGPDDKPSAGRGWRILDQWQFNGQVFTPDVKEATIDALREGALVLPPPPKAFDEDPSSDRLWIDIRDFVKRWVVLRPEAHYDVVTGWIMLTYRVWDGGFEHMGYLRAYGPRGAGKSRLLDVIRGLAWHSYSSAPSATNIHRVIEYYRDITLVMDEFHLDHKNREDRMALCDLLNYGASRTSSLEKIEKTSDGKMEPRRFRLFGPKALGSYQIDEEEGFARRTIPIHMQKLRDSDLPHEIGISQLPAEFYAQATALRARLAWWRGTKSVLAAPQAKDSHRYFMLREAAGADIAQFWWAIVEMVPGGVHGAFENIVTAAAARRAATQDTREQSLSAYLMGMIADKYEDGGCWFDKAGDYWVRTADLRDSDRFDSVTTVTSLLREAGLEHRQVWARQQPHAPQRQIKAWRIGGKAFIEACWRYGIAWPRNPGNSPNPKESAL